MCPNYPDKRFTLLQPVYSVLAVLPESLFFAALLSWAHRNHHALQLELQSRQQVYPLYLLDRLKTYFRRSVWFLLALFGFQVLLGSLVNVGSKFQTVWMFDEGGPELVWFGLICGVCFSFGPGKNFRSRCGSMRVDDWGGNRLAYPHQTGFRQVSDRFQTSALSDLRSPCHSVAQSCDRVMSGAQTCRMHSVISEVLTEIQESGPKVVQCWYGSGPLMFGLCVSSSGGRRGGL